MNLPTYGRRLVMGSFQSLTNAQSMVSVLLFPDEEGVEEFMDLIREDIPDVSWEYVEEEKPGVSGLEAYMLHFVDQYSDPVPDVKVNFCTDAACTLQIADENGLVRFSAPVENYHVQLLKVPEGYSFDPGFELFTGDAFGEWNILVRKD